MPAQDYVGSAACAGCHEQAYAQWRQSDHRHAMEPAAPSAVLGNFNDAAFDYFGRRSRFFSRDGHYFVTTDNRRGETETFEIAYTLGFYPLQQYLIAFPDGRLQALSLSWDSRPKDIGGQRWYHLYPNDPIAAGDPLHWTGAFQNFNSRCASCHTTDLEKNYSVERDAYDTRWTEIGVGCEACHGPGARHLAWANGSDTLHNKGFEVDLHKVWEPRNGELPIPRDARAPLSQQLAVCGGCHSRREELQHPDVTRSYFDNYRLAALDEALYFPDGQMRDEVYVMGSFLQSKMHQNHVSCTNCHDPHTNRLRIEGNGLCLECHRAQKYQTETHFFHSPSSAGAQCVSCHMPTRTYMGVDRRRDHSFRVPDPIASVELGVPNACTQCHTDRTDQWAADIVAKRTGRTAPYYAHAAALAAARRNDASAGPTLLEIATGADEPAILRSIALIESARFPSEEQVRTAATAMRSPDPLLRASAASALSFFDAPRRLAYLQPLLADPVKSVRMAVARQLTDLPAEQVPATLRTQFDGLLAEYRATLRYNADMPEAMTELGLSYAGQGDLKTAEGALRQARKLAPHYLAAMLNLADVYRAEGRDELGAPLLEEAMAAYPESGDVRYALGLLYVRTNRKPDSVALLEAASRLSPTNTLYVVVYAVALAEVGRAQDAIRVLEDAAQRFPDDPQIRETLSAYKAQQ